MINEIKLSYDDIMDVKTYKEYTEIVLKLWMDNLITDAEHSKLIDRINERYNSEKVKT